MPHCRCSGFEIVADAATAAVIFVLAVVAVSILTLILNDRKQFSGDYDSVVLLGINLLDPHYCANMQAHDIDAHRTHTRSCSRVVWLMRMVLHSK